MNKYSIFILPVLVMLAGCSREPEEQVFNIAMVTQRDIIVSVDAAGIIEPETTVEVKSKASGEILEIHSDTGDLVEVGSLIVQIDKRTPKNSLAQAEAELEAAHARRSIARRRPPAPRHCWSPARSMKSITSKPCLNLQTLKLRWCVPRSQSRTRESHSMTPKSGHRSPAPSSRKTLKRVRSFRRLHRMSARTELLKMADLRSVQVRALVDETDIGKIIAEQNVVIEVAAYPNQPFEGRVLKIEPQAADEEAVTLFSVIITINKRKWPAASRHECGGRDHDRQPVRRAGDSDHSAANHGRFRAHGGLRGFIR